MSDGYLGQIIAEAWKDLDAGTFPFSLGVEVTNHCNLRCPMCPREIADRGYGNMDFELFKKIADQAAGRKRVLFEPQGFGESFIHPKFREMLRYLQQARVELVMVITNGTYLTAENCHGLIDAEVPLVNISLDGTVKEVYEKIRVNADLEKVEEGVRRLFELRKKRGARFPHIILRMIQMKETAEDVERFKERWQPHLVEGDEIAFSQYQTWSNTVEDKRVEEHGSLKLRKQMEGTLPPCRMIYKTLQVYYDGRSTLCCYDYDCTMEVGNAKEQSIEEIWSGDRAQHYRHLHETGRMDEIPICRGCQEYQP